MSKKTHHDAHRSARTGQFVPQRAAERKPAEHVKERVPNPGRGENAEQRKPVRRGDG
jgi:hypothetical protein